MQQEIQSTPQALTSSEPQHKKKRFNWKVKFIIFLILIVIAAGAYGYYWFTDTQALRLEARTVIQDAQKYLDIKKSINSERDRCEVFITQSEGNFSEFEYCKGFIEWQANSHLNK